MDSVNNNVMVAKAYSVRMSVERNSIRARIKESVLVLQTFTNANLDQIEPLRSTKTTVNELLESGRFIIKSNYSLMIVKSTQEV